MKKPYNRIVLIGNGFNKALGFKTGYYDFILDYLKEGAIKVFQSKKYENDLLIFEMAHNPFDKPLEEHIDTI